MNGLKVMGCGYSNPSDQSFELVERKGLGHPDTLADAIAEEVSCSYSQYCIERFDTILHHNIDKLYIGAGFYHRDFGEKRMIKPVRVVTNGRISNSFGDQEIPVADIQRKAIKNVLRERLPNLDLSEELVIDTNSTQHTKNSHWFTPRDIKDVPDAVYQTANDTSVCVAHAPMTVSENLAFQLERFLWDQDSEGCISPKFSYVGQDVKVMVLREERKISVVLCLPQLAHKTTDWEEYHFRNTQLSKLLSAEAESIVGESYEIDLKVNPSRGSIPLVYLLANGSCIDCGEEGLVGRGNSFSGVISIMRQHSVEAASGKNPQYHTGRVMGYLTDRLAKAIYRDLGLYCTVIALTKNQHSLVPPYRLFVSLDKNVDNQLIEEIVEREMINVDFRREIVNGRFVR